MSADVSKVIRAANFAAVKHRLQRRKDPEKTPYINHPLVTVGKVTDADTLAAAILHDTVENTDTTLQEIEDEFGYVVRSIVAEVTDDKSLPREKRKQLQIEHAPTRSHEAKLVKLADKLYNLMDLMRVIPEGWTEERAEQYFEWSAKVVKGLLGTNESLEQELRKIFIAKNIALS